jgi:phosphate transport system permease protein
MQSVLDTKANTYARAELLAKALGKPKPSPDSLKKRPRIGEEIIRGILFCAGVFSIFTTIFIVYFLGREALSFFGSRAWLAAKTVIVDEGAPALMLRQNPQEGAISATSNLLLFELAPSERVALPTGTFIRIDSEIMQITERRENSVIVARGRMGTTAAPHAAGSTIIKLTNTTVRSVNALPAEATQIALEPGYGSAFTVGQIIQIGGEVMQVMAVAPDSITVERGLEGTTIAEHGAGEVINTEKRVTLLEYVTSTRWQPQVGDFGILPLVNATLMTTFFAIVVALPTGLGVAIFLSEYASPHTRGILGPVLELLVGVPTVVYGYFALNFVTQGVLQPLFGSGTVNIYNTLSAGIVVGIMIIPTIASMSIDAMSAVPRALREASYALGATKLETTVKVVLPAALSGVVAAVILGLSRAIGETMIVAVAAGAGPNFTFNPFIGAETMTGHIARISGGDIQFQSLDYQSLFAIGLTLFLITFVLTQISTAITRRFREVYE